MRENIFEVEGGTFVQSDNTVGGGGKNCRRERMNFSFPRVKKEGMIKLTAWKGILEKYYYKIVSHWIIRT